jgi:hypothetical protein
VSPGSSQSSRIESTPRSTPREAGLIPSWNSRKVHIQGHIQTRSLSRSMSFAGVSQDTFSGQSLVFPSASTASPSTRSSLHTHFSPSSRFHSKLRHTKSVSTISDLSGRRVEIAVPTHRSSRQQRFHGMN